MAILKTSQTSLLTMPLGGEEDSVEIKVYGDCRSGAERPFDFAKPRLRDLKCWVWPVRSLLFERATALLKMP